MTIWTNKQISGWGRYPVVEADCARPERRSELLRAIQDRNDQPLLAHGLGRSYGDAALLSNGRMLLGHRLDRMLAFDEDTGTLRAEAGVSISDLVHTFADRGFFPPVVPGTQFVTVGGAIGCNIHGKNHIKAGCFGDHVQEIELVTAHGEIVVCSRQKHPELFHATSGGMGLTGVILSATFSLYPIESRAIAMESIRFENLDEFYQLSQESRDYTHTVSWIDCVATGHSLGRGIFMRGEHAARGQDSADSSVLALASQLQSLMDGRVLSHNWLLNPATIRLFNEAYFRKEPAGLTRKVVDLMPFFFPLDSVPHWNHIYGPRGFLQYQLVVEEREALSEILTAITQSKMASFLAVIKEFGDQDHGGLSFPKRGTTLALDFPNVGDDLHRLMEKLDDIVVAAGGRIYLGKDARVSKENFRRMYPDWEAWKEVRDRWDPQNVFQSDLGLRLGLVQAGV